MKRNIHPDEAVSIVTEKARKVFPFRQVERIPLSESLGRALTHEMISPIDHPPFDKSAMDGFAYSQESHNAIYRVVDTVAAGRSRDIPISEGESVRIMTGAPLPAGTRAVQRIEWTEAVPAAGEEFVTVRFTRKESVSNIIRKGENLGAGKVLLGPRILEAQDIGILASAGIAEVEVSAVPKIAVISTGDEIVGVGTMKPLAAIFDSNGPQLCAQSKKEGASVEFLGIAPDEESALRDILGRGLGTSDVVIISGGVSMGDFDLVPKMLVDLGVEPVFHSLAMRPGKPTFFGMKENVAVFGLPGNPVSTFVNFEVLVKPYLRGIQGLAHTPRTLSVTLTSPLSRKGSDRVEFMPARLVPTGEGIMAEPLSYRGSSMVTVLAEADILLRMEIGQERIDAGESTHARLVRP